jgi:hypothetical protein
MTPLVRAAGEPVGDVGRKAVEATVLEGHPRALGNRMEPDLDLGRGAGRKEHASVLEDDAVAGSQTRIRPISKGSSSPCSSSRRPPAPGSNRIPVARSGWFQLYGPDLLESSRGLDADLDRPDEAGNPAHGSSPSLAASACAL